MEKELKNIIKKLLKKKIKKQHKKPKKQPKKQPRKYIKKIKLDTPEQVKPIDKTQPQFKGFVYPSAIQPTAQQESYAQKEEIQKLKKQQEESNKKLKETLENLDKQKKQLLLTDSEGFHDKEECSQI